MRNRCILSLFIIILTATASCNMLKADQKIYVSPAGNDSWSGKLQSANADKSDGPLASLDAARNAARKLHTSGAGNETIRVVIADGRYEIAEPIVFGPEDSGSKNAPIIYESAPNARPVFSGGKKISGFTQRKDGLWETHLDDVAAGKWYFEQLWVNGNRAVRARTPNSGYLRMKSYVGIEFNPVTGKTEDMSRWAFTAHEKDFAKLASLPQSELDDVQVTTYSAWQTAAHRVSALDAAKSIVKLNTNANWPFSMGNIGAPRYHLENYRQALDSPGEWFLDRNGVLLYKPLPGQKIQSAQVYAPVASDFLVFAGNVESGKTVDYIQFKGLTFEHSQYLLPKEGRKSIQAEYETDAVITGINARNIWFDQCNFRHTGKYVFWFRYGSRDCAVTRCLMEDLGAGGVKIGEFRYYDEDKMLAKHIIVDNNIIRAGGRVQTAGIGVLIGDSPDNLVTHNDISDLFYTAISAGWNWAYTPTNASNNKIDFNHLHHLGYGVLSDMGGVYTLGLSEGTTVNNNVIHDVYAHQYGGWGLYNDAATTHMMLANNLVYHCGSGGYHQNFGKENHVTNNIFAYCGEGQIIRSTQEQHISFTFDRNIVIYDTVLLGGEWSNNRYIIDNNLYFNTTGKQVTFGNSSMVGWNAKGHDLHSIIADPKFKNPKKLDFRLKPGSPAEKIGFIPFDYTKAGVYGDRDWIKLAKDYTYAKPEIVKPLIAADFIKCDFESTAAGTYPMDFGTVFIEGKGESIAVADETAASGKHSLKFTDVSGLMNVYNPHCDIRLKSEDNKTVVCSFDVKVEANAVFWHEWRDWTSTTYIQGPSIRIAEGRLMAGSEALMDIPLSTWIHIKISCPIGNRANGKYDVTVNISGNTERVFKGLACLNSAFSRVNYVNFVADANREAVFYIDNVEMK